MQNAGRDGEPVESHQVGYIHMYPVL